jgi:hypothetical protein
LKTVKNTVFILSMSLNILFAYILFFQEQHQSERPTVANDKFRESSIEEALKESEIPFANYPSPKILHTEDMEGLKIAFYKYTTDYGEDSLGAAIIEGDIKNGWKLLSHHMDHITSESMTINEIPIKRDYKMSIYNDIIFGYIEDERIVILKYERDMVDRKWMVHFRMQI